MKWNERIQRSKRYLNRIEKRTKHEIYQQYIIHIYSSLNINGMLIIICTH